METEELETMEYEALSQLRDHAVLLDKMLTELGYDSISLGEVEDLLETLLEP